MAFPDPLVECFEHPEEQDAKLAEEVARTLAEAIEQRGYATLVVSGGRTPVGFFQALSQYPLEWGKVTITLADERWVPLTHKDSNEKLLRYNLLINQAERALFLSMSSWDESPYEGLQTIVHRIQELPRFDVVLLGMGLDGHTASLFPHSTELEEAFSTQAPCLPVTPITAPHRRMSMSLSRLLNSRRIFLQLRGADKFEVYQQALAGEDIYAMPIRAILKQQQTPVEVYYAP